MTGNGSKLSSEQFEQIAKRVVADTLRNVHNIDVSYEELNFVWFAYVLKNMKCLIWGPKMHGMYAEVTYSAENNAIYTDIYEKRIHRESSFAEISEIM